MEVYYVGILGATDYWMCFKSRHRGSPHVHGLAWLPNAPDVETILSTSNTSDEAKEVITQYVDNRVSTGNPAVPDPHVCNQVYTQIEDYEQDLADLVATCQRHT